MNFEIKWVISDNLHLQSKAKDQLFPDICELVVSMDRMTALPETIKEPAKLWESTLKPMNASDEITGKLHVGKIS